MGLTCICVVEPIPPHLQLCYTSRVTALRLARIAPDAGQHERFGFGLAAAKAPVPLYEFEQEECRTAKKLTSWQFLTIRLLVSSAHNYSWGIPNKPSRSRQDLLRDR